MMGFLLLLLTLAHIEPVKLQDETLILQSETPCEGHVEIYRNNKWGYVGRTNWDESTEEVVCRSTHCGTPLKNFTGSKLRPLNSTVWLDKVKCSGSEERLWDCEYPEWDIDYNRDQTIKTVKCSDQISFTLDGYPCAGAVKYSINGEPGYICEDNWGQKEANLLCQSLGCGENERIPTKKWFGGTDFQGSKKMKIKCSDTAHLKNLWQCVDQESTNCQRPATVICKDFKRVQLKGDGSNVCSGLLEKEENQEWTPVKDDETSPEVWCRQMHCGDSYHNSTNGGNVTCSDNVKIVLRDKNKDSECYGVVHTEVNGKSYPVCASSWTKDEAEVVCRERNCGRVIDFKKKSGLWNGIMDNVQCSGTESSLWHCMARHYDTPFKCQSAAYVICAGSIDVTLKDGLGRCAGRVEIEYEGQWKRATKKTWNEENSDVVCKYLDCGDAIDSDPGNLYSPGSGDFLEVDVTCESSESHISECITTNQKSGLDEAVGITCEKHKIVFLDGDHSCSGLVGIEQGSTTSWLSGSEWTKEVADTVCRQMHCEEALNFTSKYESKAPENVWNESYICSSNSTSLSECNTTEPSSKKSVASVECRGTIKVNLTKECWGNINICMNDTCGSVCNDTWTDEKSNMLCQSLQCGHALPNPKGPLLSIKVSFKSMHIRKHTNGFSWSNFVKSDEKETCKQNAAAVVCSGSVDVRIGSTSEHCSGKVEVLYAGHWLPVCMTALADSQTQHTICEKIQCGRAVKKLDFYGPTSGGHSISKIQCAGDVKLCNVTSDDTTCDAVGLQCSRHRKMELESGTACSGALLVYSEKKRSAVSEDGWTEAEGNRLCQDLKCGKLVSKRPMEPMIESFWNSSFTCKGNPQSIWDCENEAAPNKTNQLFIECQDELKVSLSEKCGGQLTMNKIRLSSTHWAMGYSDLVCLEMNCSKAVGTDLAPQSKEERYNVQCAMYHSSLGRCKSFKARQDARSVSVYCADRVKFGTTDKYRGQLLVNYRKKWEKVCFKTPLSAEYKTKLCEELNNTGTQTDISDKYDTTFDCNKTPNDIRYCVRQGDCTGIKPAEISCGTEPPPQQTRDSPNMVVVILGSLILLVLVIVAFVFVRNLIVRRSKRASNVKANMFLRNVEEPESGDYEDVVGTRPGMENFSEEFRPEAKFIQERDARSTSSFPYDDVDEDQLLTASQATFMVSSRNNQSPAGTSTLRADREAIEMDEPRRSSSENDSPEITEAEVHDQDHNRQADFPAPPVEPLLEVEDYLEPDQNG